MTPLPRSQFPVADRWRYFDHAGVAPLPRAAAAAMVGYATAMRDGGVTAGERHEAREPAVRSAGAVLMGVPVDDVAFVKNTTEGLSLVASGLDWRSGDRVLVPACEFPSNLYPWLALAGRGVSVELVPAPRGRPAMEAFEARLRGGRVRLVAVSWVQYGRGYRTDLAELGRLCRRYEALLCVDAIQGLGVIPARFDQWGVDFAAADGHKWMLGPEGVGLMYARTGSREALRVLQPGWNSVSHRGDLENPVLRLDATARRFEGGTPNRAGVGALGESLDLLLNAGVHRVWAHVGELCDRLATGLSGSGHTVLSDRSPAARSAIVTFQANNTNPEELCRRLQRQGVVAAPRAGGVRLSPHGYNTVEEVDSLLAAVAGSRR